MCRVGYTDAHGNYDVELLSGLAIEPLRLAIRVGDDPIAEMQRQRRRRAESGLTTAPPRGCAVIQRARRVPDDVSASDASAVLVCRHEQIDELATRDLVQDLVQTFSHRCT